MPSPSAALAVPVNRSGFGRPRQGSWTPKVPGRPVAQNYGLLAKKYESSGL